MTLTRRGRDYLAAAAVMAVVLGLKGPAVTSTVPFALALVAAVSLLVSSLSSEVVPVSAGVGRVRLFKGESVSIPVSFGSSPRRWMSLASISLGAQSWAGSEVRRTRDGRGELVVTPRVAGRFEGLSAVADEVDPLGLFEFHRMVKIDVQLESLPRSLRRRGTLPRTAYGSVGENPSGRAGSGQEMFGITEYQSGLDASDIMWKRAAKLAGEVTRLPLLIREGSARKSVRVGLAVGSGRTQEERDGTIDRVSEALGQLGNDLLLVGATIEVLYGVEGKLRTTSASNSAELGDLVVGPWIDSDGTMDPRVLSRGVELLVLESDSPGQLRELAEDGQAPILLVSGAAPHVRLPPRAAAFTGEEDLTELAGWVLAA